MAELLLKIAAGSGFEDGDILCAFNRRRIRCVHAEHICHQALLGKGHRPSDSLAAAFREFTHQYRFERVSRTEIDRIEIATGNRERFGAPAIDVPLFVARRLGHDRHAIFGVEGKEVWYGGKIDVSDAAMDRVWAAVANKTGRLESEAEFTLWPMGRLDIRHHLAVRVVDFTDAEAEAFVRPQVELGADGTPVLYDPETGKPSPDGQPKVLAKRNLKVDWRVNLLDDLGVTENQVLDRDFAVGRDVVVAAGRLRHESKPQPEQSDTGKLHDKSRGGPAVRSA